MCRYDHGMSWAEFEDLTLAQLEALEERRAASIRHKRFNAALIVSAIFNANRGPDTEYLSPFALIPGFEDDPEDVDRQMKHREAVKSVRYAVMGWPREWNAEQVRVAKTKMIERMKASGCEDAEDVFREAWPNL